MRASVHRLLVRAKTALVRGLEVKVVTSVGLLPIIDIVFEVDGDEPIEISLEGGETMIFEVSNPPAFVLPF